MSSPDARATYGLRFGMWNVRYDGLLGVEDDSVAERAMRSSRATKNTSNSSESCSVDRRVIVNE